MFAFQIHSQRVPSAPISAASCRTAGPRTCPLAYQAVLDAGVFDEQFAATGPDHGHVQLCLDGTTSFG